ncbi:MAG: SufE family protein [Planctomycetaceae bacterium]|nr:SufE family protein [Planctomycetaceae bacterium]
MIDRLKDEQKSLSSLEEIVDEFDFLNDPYDQLNYLIDLGLDLPKIDSSLKTEQYLIHGCQNNVWLDVEFYDEPAVMLIKAESEAKIVNGIVAVLMAIFNGKTAQQGLDFNVREAFDRLGLDKLIGSQRKNGLNGMVQKIREAARWQLAQDA